MTVEKTKPVAVIGAPLDLGAGRRGVDMGPSAIRYAGLDERLRAIGRGCRDFGNVDSPVAEAADMGDERARYLRPVLDTCEQVSGRVEQAIGEGFVPLVLGGDHSIALATIGTLAKSFGPGGVIWIDAHGDLNTPETTPSGNVHGMVLAAVLGLGRPAFDRHSWPLPAADPTRVALIAVRSLDPAERQLIRELGVKAYTMSDVDRLGVERVLHESLAHVAGPGFVHVSLDMDAVDPEVAPGVGTPVRGGLSYREAHLALELIAESGLPDSLDLVEVNPIFDRQNATGQLAVELAASALGATIL